MSYVHANKLNCALELIAHYQAICK